MFAGQGWFEIAGQVVLIFTAITGALPDKFVQKIPILSTVWPIFNWLAGNVFNNINHPKGMAASADVEKEIEKLLGRSPDHTKEIKKYYKKPSNRQRIEDDLLEKKVLDYLAEFAKIKDVKVHTKILREEATKEGD